MLNDRRPSEELQDYELRRRLEVYRQYDRDERYGADQRAYWREVRQRDEALLQQRLIRERRQRQAELASRYEDGSMISNWVKAMILISGTMSMLPK